MFESFEENYKMIGMSKTEIMDLMGDENGFDEENNTLRYFFVPGMSDLILCFNEEDMVYKYYIYNY